MYVLALGQLGNKAHLIHVTLNYGGDKHGQKRKVTIAIINKTKASLILQFQFL
jgi:hypothetical protein